VLDFNEFGLVWGRGRADSSVGVVELLPKRTASLSTGNEGSDLSNIGDAELLVDVGIL
jgi:hypothetical protein